MFGHGQSVACIAYTFPVSCVVVCRACDGWRSIFDMVYLVLVMHLFTRISSLASENSHIGIYSCLRIPHYLHAHSKKCFKCADNRAGGIEIRRVAEPISNLHNSHLLNRRLTD